MAAFNCTGGSMALGTTDGLEINVRNFSLSAKVEALEVTAFGNASRQFIPGLTSFSGRWSGFMDGTVTMAFPATTVTFTYTAGTGADAFSGTLLITDVTIGSDVQGVGTYDATFQGTGTVTIA